MDWRDKFKSMFKTNLNSWQEGVPPRHWPRSWIEEGMMLYPNDPNTVVTCWRKSTTYYQQLV